MGAEKILDSHEILYESRNVLLVNNRCEDALADYWDNDVVVWDPDIQAVIGAGNRLPDGTYEGFYIYGPNAPEVYGDTAGDFAENVILASHTVEGPYSELFDATLKNWLSQNLDGQSVGYVDWYCEWSAGGFESDGGVDVPYEGLAAVARVYLPQASNTEPLMVSFNVAYWCEPHYALGDTVPTDPKGGPCKIENLGTIDLRKATRKDFPYIESECLVYRAVALALNKSGQVPELLAQIEDEVLRIDIAQEISNLEVEDE